ncbi:hypothetical protein MAHJHV55_51760 [Mycobacterium avium subsp. hominissuis]
MAKRLRRLGVGVLESVTVTEVRWNEVVLSDGPSTGPQIRVTGRPSSASSDAR